MSACLSPGMAWCLVSRMASHRFGRLEATRTITERPKTLISSESPVYISPDHTSILYIYLFMDYQSISTSTYDILVVY